MRTSDDKMRGLWEHVFFTELGILDERHAKGRQGPCPICGGKDRFRFDDKEQRGTWFCNACGAGDGYALYMAMLKLSNFNEAVKECEKRFGTLKPKIEEKKLNTKAILTKLWKGTTNDSSEIIKYLRHRGIERIPDDVVGRTLRFHPFCPWRDGSVVGYAPAMLARVFHPDGTSATIHRTFLTTDVPMRKMLLPHDGKLSGCVIPLGKPAAHHMGVAEGIETALSAFEMDGVVTWATYCADQLEKFVVPTTIDKLDIFGDNDSSFVGQAAAYRLAKSALHKRKELSVEVHIPALPDTDWNDVLQTTKGDKS